MLPNCPHIWCPDGLHVSRVTVLAARESDPSAGSQSTLGMSDCQGLLSALFANWKKFVPFDPKVCISTNVFMRILHRSGRTRSSSQFRDPKSLLRLLIHRRRGLSASKAIPVRRSDFMEKEAAVSLPLRNGKEDSSWCQSQGLSSSRRTQVDAPM